MNLNSARRTILLGATASVMAFAALPGHALGAVCQDCPDPGGGGGGGNGGGPAATITSGPSGVIDTTDATFKFVASKADASTTFICNIDGSPWALCTSPSAFHLLPEGTHTVRVAAGEAGIYQANPPERTFVVDTTNPVITFTSGPAYNARTTDAQPKYDFTVDDATALTVSCRVDFSAWEPCNGSYTPYPLTDGFHNIAVKAVDAAGHTRAGFRNVTVDTAAPDVKLTGPATATANATPTFTYSAPYDDGGSYTFECKIDGGAAQNCSGGQSSGTRTLATLADGPHTFAVRGTDGAGNHSAYAQSFFSVDTTGPAVTFASGPAEGETVLTGAQTFGFDAEAGTTFECGLDGAALAACASPFTTAVLGAGGHTVAVRGTDALGNHGDTITRSFTVADPPPVATPTPTPVGTPAPKGRKHHKAKHKHHKRKHHKVKHTHHKRAHHKRK